MVLRLFHMALICSFLSPLVDFTQLLCQQQMSMLRQYAYYAGRII